MKQPPEGADMMRIRDWRQALRSPPTYRIVNRTLRNQKHFISVLSAVGILVLFILYALPSRRSEIVIGNNNYNHTYPLTMPIKTSGMHTFRIGIIADLDTNSKSATEPHTWYSYLKKGFLSYSPVTNSVVVTWDSHEALKLTTNFASKGRGMELSELVVFDGRLLTFDDRTGMVFEIVRNEAVPWVLLMDGDGRDDAETAGLFRLLRDSKALVPKVIRYVNHLLANIDEPSAPTWASNFLPPAPNYLPYMGSYMPPSYCWPSYFTAMPPPNAPVPPPNPPVPPPNPPVPPPPPSSPAPEEESDVDAESELDEVEPNVEPVAELDEVEPNVEPVAETPAQLPLGPLPSQKQSAPMTAKNKGYKGKVITRRFRKKMHRR